ncbi:MAG: DUF91 domain-containing protein [Haloferacaceae archaeon]
MPATIQLLAGDCTATFEGTRERTQRGYVVVVVKPDRTVLVHDADGYQPVAWLTHPDDLTIERDDDAFGLTASTDEQTLRVVSHSVTGTLELPASAAGVPVGSDPDSGAPLVRTGGDVLNLDSGRRYSLPAGATVLEERCEACGLPRTRVERGEVFERCIDYACESLLEAVRERFDRAWDCPDCGSPLRIFRMRGGPITAGCTAYPDCEAAFVLPAGRVVGECACGLPVFETAAGRRCLDGNCERYAAEKEGVESDGSTV